MTVSNEYIGFLVWPLPETGKGILWYCLVSALPCVQYVAPSPLRRANGLRGGGTGSCSFLLGMNVFSKNKRAVCILYVKCCGI